MSVFGISFRTKAYETTGFAISSQGNKYEVGGWEVLSSGWSQVGP